MEVTLRLLGRFSMSVDGVAVDLPHAGQRVVALVAMRGGTANRSRLAGTLWPDRPDQRSLANLRSALWRMPQVAAPTMSTAGLTIRCEGEWNVDLHTVDTCCRHIADREEIAATDRRLFADDLLPQWDESWLDVPRESHRQLRLHGLELLAARELESGRSLDAVDTALVAVSADPLRESAQLLLMRAHLAAGNRAAALRCFTRFEHTLKTELNLAPSAPMATLAALARGEHVGDTDARDDRVTPVIDITDGAEAAVESERRGDDAATQGRPVRNGTADGGASPRHA